MARAKADYEELRKFANGLQNYLDTVEDETGRISGRLNELSETWDDPNQKAFQEIFDDLKRHLKKFIDDAEEQIPYIRKQADILEEYEKSKNVR